MNILQVNNYHYKKGGTETVFLNTIDLLRNNGHKVYSLSLADSRNENINDESFFVKKQKVISNKFYSFDSVDTIKSLLKNNQIDLVHIHNIIGGITFSILPIIKKMNIPIVASIHDFRYLCPVYTFLDKEKKICELCADTNYYNCIVKNCSEGGILQSIAISAESYLRDSFLPNYKFINSFLFVSEFTKAKFLEYKKHLFNKSIRLYNFTQKFSDKASRGNYFLYFGRLVEYKGIRTLIEAFRKNQNSRLKIVGEGPIKSWIEKENLKNVEVCGYMHGSELEEIVNSSSFVIVPSEVYENNPMSIIEAFANSKPVIGSKIGGIPELVRNSETGYLFEAANADQLAERIYECENISDKSYKDLAKNAYSFAKENFSSAVYYNNLMHIYENTLKKGDV